jgi:hypothetical protein
MPQTTICKHVFVFKYIVAHYEDRHWHPCPKVLLHDVYFCENCLIERKVFRHKVNPTAMPQNIKVVKTGRWD